MGSMRLFLDANILVSGIAFHGNEHKLLIKNTRTIVFITSEDALDETRKTLTIKFPNERNLIDTFLKILPLTIIKRKRYVKKLTQCTIVRDTKDKHILVASELSREDYIVTSDADLLSLKIYKNIPIVKAREVLALLR